MTPKEQDRADIIRLLPEKEVCFEIKNGNKLCALTEYPNCHECHSNQTIAESADKLLGAITKEMEVSQIIQNVKYVGMLKHFNICKAWADDIASALHREYITLKRKDT